MMTLLLLADHRATAQDDYCNGLKPGHIMVSGFNMADPDEVVLVLLENAPPNGVFYMTDRPWDGSAFVDDESLSINDDGVLQWSFGEQVSNFLAGREICYKCTQDGSVVDRFRPVETSGNNSTFSLDAVKGDTIHLYCQEQPNDSGVSEIVHISAITTEGWADETSATTTTVDEDTEASDAATNSTSNSPTDSSTLTPTTRTTTTETTSITTSVLPSSLAETTYYTTLTNNFPNYEYDGDTVGTAEQIRSELSDAAYWDGHADYIDNLQTQSSFKIVGEYSGGNSRTTTGAGAWCCVLAAVFSFSHFLRL